MSKWLTRIKNRDLTTAQSDLVEAQTHDRGTGKTDKYISSISRVANLPVLPVAGVPVLPRTEEGEQETSGSVYEPSPEYFKLVPDEYTHFPIGIRYWLGRILTANSIDQAVCAFTRFSFCIKKEEFLNAGEAVLNQKCAGLSARHTRQIPGSKTHR
ncbi:MAG: hypothetical protein K2X93_16195 [Candidatus Obscuribacterales bacterium]|nr:hypothetical protein [Candidatus Obscuribacterales bacterium]